MQHQRVANIHYTRAAQVSAPSPAFPSPVSDTAALRMNDDPSTALIQPDAAPSPQTRKPSAGPAATVRHGSTSVPIYRIISGTRTRFAISWYRDGKRMRQVFRTIEAAKKEALVGARQIHAGMQHLTDPRAC
jgi:hypothetical protein